MSKRLIERVSNDLLKSRTVRPKTVSEILLKLSTTYRRLGNNLMSAGFTINADGLLTPFKRGEWQKYVSTTPRDRPVPPMRVEVRDKLLRRYSKSTLDAWLWPPKGTGMWNQHTRTFQSVYEQLSRKSGIKIPADVANKHGIVNGPSMERAIREGAIALFGPTTVDVVPSGRLNRIRTPMLKTPANIPQLNVLYRGTTHRYKQPLMPSAYREFGNRSEAQKFDRILRFTINLTIEAVADEFGVSLTHNQSESIIQHYKILPWTRMIDLTPDVNIAKAFASNHVGSDSRPSLYQIIVYNLGFFDTGSELIYELPFSRPRLQSAVAHFGLGLDMTTNNAIEKFALIVAATEHVIGKDNSNWERFGGQSFSIQDVKLPGPFLNVSNHQRLKALLYPRESEPRAQRALSRIVQTLEQNLDTFSELDRRREVIQNGLNQLKSLSLE